MIVATIAFDEEKSFEMANRIISVLRGKSKWTLTLGSFSPIALVIQNTVTIFTGMRNALPLDERERGGVMFTEMIFSFFPKKFIFAQWVNVKNFASS